MSWRTVIISSTAKLDYQMGYLVIRKDDVTKIHLSEIETVMIESTSVSLTATLLCELTKKKIKVIFCDEKRNPSSELISYYGAHDTSLPYRSQCLRNFLNLSQICLTKRKPYLQITKYIKHSRIHM